MEKTGDFNDEKQWWDIYEIRVRNPNHPLFGQKVTYGRAYAQMVKHPQNMYISYFFDEVEQLIRHFSIKKEDRVLVLGCGFGYLVEAFIDFKFQKVWGVDNSTWIHAHRATESREDVPIINIDASDSGIYAKLTEETGDPLFDWVIDEHILEGYMDGQHEKIIAAMNTLTDKPSKVIHMVQPISEGKTGDPSMNWKTLDEWAAIYPNNRWIAPGRDEVR